jgi:hypothetical protein
MVEWYKNRISTGPLNGYNPIGTEKELKKANKWLKWGKHGGVENIEHFIDATISKQNPEVNIILYVGQHECNIEDSFTLLLNYSKKYDIENEGFYTDGCLYIDCTFPIPKKFHKKWNKLFKTMNSIGNLDKLPIELVKYIILLSPEGTRTFFDCLLINKTIYNCFTEEEKEKEKEKCLSHISIGRIFRNHHDIQYVDKLSVSIGEKFNIGVLCDMMDNTCHSFSLLEGKWKIWDYYDHSYYIFGCHSLVIDGPKAEQPMHKIYESEGSDSHYGIVRKNIIFDSLLQSFYEDDMLEFEEDDKLTFTEWFEDLDKSTLALYVKDNLSGTLTFGRGEDNFILHGTFDEQENLISFWLLPSGDDPIDHLIRI